MGGLALLVIAGWVLRAKGQEGAEIAAFAAMLLALLVPSMGLGHLTPWILYGAVAGLFVWALARSHASDGVPRHARDTRGRASESES